MPKEFRSQWDFGELFEHAAKQQPRKIWAVGELTSRIRELLEAEFGEVWVTGEVSNLKVQASGHIYFTLKDEQAQIACVLFRGQDCANRELLADGRRLVLRSELTVYEPRGQYQLVVREIELAGRGALQLAFEKLKQKLAAEGLFDPARKRPLPRFPVRIGLVTSPTGAAIRDILHVLRRRYAGLEIVFVPTRVQGEGAAAEIANAIAMLNQWHMQMLESARALPEPERPRQPGLDLILVARGGGSLEDLWAFNEEVVARAVFASVVPVVSAVGHEIDFTICDFVADVRAATPSAAAELITEGYVASRKFVFEDAAARLWRRLTKQLQITRDRFSQLTGRLARMHPRRQLAEYHQLLDEYMDDLTRALNTAAATRAEKLRGLAGRLWALRPARTLTARRDAFVRAAEHLVHSAALGLERKRRVLDQAAAKLKLLGPEHVLARGYSITIDPATGRVVRSAAEAMPGKLLRTRVRDGDFLSRVESSGTQPTHADNA